MRTTFTILSLAVFLLISCKKESDITKEITKNDIESTKNGTKQINTDSLIGVWEGAFGNKYLELKITDVTKDSIFGVNIVNKNKRPVKGYYKLEDQNKFTARLAEPGTDKYDGVFYITFDTSTFLAKGYWESNNGKLKRDFTLEKGVIVAIEEKNIQDSTTDISKADKLITETEKCAKKLKQVLKKMKYYGASTPYSVVEDYEEVMAELQKLDKEAKLMSNDLTNEQKKRLENLAEEMSEFILAYTTN